MPTNSIGATVAINQIARLRQDVTLGVMAEVWLPDCENEGRLAAVPAWLAMAADYFGASSDSGLGSIAVLPLLTRASRNGRKVSAN